MPSNVYMNSNWTTWGSPKTIAQSYLEAYAASISTQSFDTTPMTQWYGPSSVFYSETSKVFRGPKEMHEWMSSLFLSFERVYHVPQEYIEIQLEDGRFKVIARFLRQFWLKGNTSKHPDISTPMAIFLVIGASETIDGYLGLQSHEVHLFWDKTKTTQLLQKALPSDS